MQYSVVTKSNLDKIVFRIDAEFYHPYFIQLEKKLDSIETATIRKANGKLDCSAFYPSIVEYYNFNKMGVPFLRVDEIQEGLINLTANTAFLPSNVVYENRNTLARCYDGDIVIAKGGNTIAKVALLTNEYKEYSLCRDLIVLRTAKLSGLIRFYLWIFLHSEYGKKSLLRTASQTGQPHLTIEALYELRIPKFSMEFQGKFKELYLIIKKQQIASLQAYEKAEQILLSELGLVDWKPKHQLSFVKNFSDSKTADRIDAEYFQPMYVELIEKVKQYGNGYKSVGDCVRIKDRNLVPKDDISYKYIELANISANGHINGFIEAVGKNLPTRARLTVNTGDLIVSSIEGSLSSIALINGELDNALCSTGFYVINSDTLNSETLLVLLKSPVGHLQLKKGCSGTILTAINKEEFKRILLPRISESIQEQIKQKISEMYKAKSASKKLLDIAKRGVELAIEQGEKEAQHWINEDLETA